MNHFINTAATDIARARTTGLNQLMPEPFPVITVGSVPTLNLFFASRGTLESWSGDASFSLRVTLGNAFSGPTDGTHSLQVGTNTPLTLPFDLDAAGLQKVLNDDAIITAEGGVEVSAQGPGRFLIAYKAAGIVSGLTADGALLVPDCTSTVSVLTTGASGVRQLVSLTLRRTVPAQITSWTPISSPYAGWTGLLPVNQAAAIELLRLNGVARGDYIECQTLLTIEVIDGSSNPTTYAQLPVTLRALNYEVAASTGTVQTILQNFFSRPSVTGLQSNVADSTKLGGLATNGAQFPVGSVMSLDFSNDVVGRWIRKSSTVAESVPWIVRPYDYNASSNPYQWIIDRVTRSGQPCFYDANTTKWHYAVAVGNANAVSIALDQTGFSLPS